MRTVYYFSAPWCGPCKRMGPVFDKVAESLKDNIEVHKIDVDEKHEMAGEFKITSVPTIVVREGDQELHRVSGCKDELTLYSLMGGKDPGPS